MIEKLMRELGLSDYETKIYLNLVNIGEAVAGKIAERAKVNRRNVYDALNRLIKRGFVSSSIKNNKKFYQAVHPKKISEGYEEKVDLVKNLLPELLKGYNNPTSEREVHVFENQGGLKTVFHKLYEERKPVYVIGATGLALDEMPFFFTQLFKKPRAKNVKVKQLWNCDANNIKTFRGLLNSEDKILPKNFKTSTQLFISGDKAVILIWSPIPLAIMIRDQGISNGFKRYFQFLWGISRRYKDS